MGSLQLLRCGTFQLVAFHGTTWPNECSIVQHQAGQSSFEMSFPYDDNLIDSARNHLGSSTGNSAISAELCEALPDKTLTRTLTPKRCGSANSTNAKATIVTVHT
eukprot:TRINITY_DN19240_c0_g1_i1.p1 TRINITY_DN19240_c0_g1~~TRINITY_DN19240_c0_g1_i1.p1  ORF type:complete len:105 (-),score=4.12 TRINITY_DN19240_c0_g1_i1:146-460(-)